MAGYNPLTMHSISIGDKNTWTDWHLIAKERPCFKPPSKKTSYVDIPGMSGSLDFSDSLTGYPTYSDREGSWSFYISNDYWKNGYSYVDLLNEISDYLDKTRMRAILQDDDQFFYYGKFSVDDYNPENPWGEIIIKYKVNPYKWSILDSNDDWLWDPFRFDTGVIQKTLYGSVVIESDSEWKEIPVDYKSTRSEAPICPDILIETTGNTGIDIHFINPDLHIDITEHFSNGQNIDPTLIITGDNCKLYARKKGSISVVFRSGEL